MRLHRVGLVVALISAAACSNRATTTSTGTSGKTSSTSTGTGTGGGTAGFRVALSVSPFTGALFANGASFSDGTLKATDTASLEAMFVAHGGNELFARLSTENVPTGSADDHSEQTALKLATLAKTMQLPFNPELGLWAHYGDITCEPGPDFKAYPQIALPGSWPTLTVDQMTVALHEYGALVAKDIVATGVTVDIWDIGNEIDFGTAGVAPKGIGCATPYAAPDAVDPAIGMQDVGTLLQEPEAQRIAWLQGHVWPHEARLLEAVREGVLTVAPGARFETHISQSKSASFAIAFYQAMISGGFSPDEMGFSYYPSSNNAPGRAAAFKDTVTQVHAMFGRPVFLAEFAYPAGPTPAGAYATWMNPIANYPIGEDGQFGILRDIASWGPSAGLSGIRPWAPDAAVPGWQGFALFASTGSFPYVARKGLDGVKQGLASPNPAAFHD